MPYATRDDMILEIGEQRLIDLTDRVDPPAGLIDDQVLDGALTYAGSTIDGFLRTRYQLPLAGSHPMLMGLCVDIAFWRLNREPTEEVRKRYEAAIAMLKQLANGSVSLPDESGGEPAAAGGTIIIESQPRLFDRRRLRGM